MVRSRVPVAVALLLLALVLRAAWPLADPPDGISWSGGMYTDPAYNYLAARYALFDPAEPSLPLVVRWIFPLLTLVVEAMGRLVGITRLSTTLLSVGLSVLALGATAWAVRRSGGPRAAVVALALGGTCIWIVLFSRILMVENLVAPMLALGAVAALGRRTRDHVIATALVVSAAAFGKYQAVGSASGILLFLVLRNRGRRTILTVLATGSVLALVWAFVVFLPHREAILSWTSQYTTAGQQGLPILRSPLAGLEELFRSFRNTRMTQRAPILLLAGGAFLFATIGNRDALRRRLADGSAVFAFWYLGGFLVNAVLAYTPPRYTIPIVYPMVAAAACQFDEWMRGVRAPAVNRPSVWIPLLVWCVFAGFGTVRAVQFWALFLNEDLFFDVRMRAGAAALWTYGLVPELTVWQGVGLGTCVAVPAFLLLAWRFHRNRGRRPRHWPKLARAALVTALVFQTVQWVWWAGHRSYRIHTIHTSLAEILAPGAVVLGSFAPMLTEGTTARAIWYPLGPGEKESELLTQVGITHALFAEPFSTSPEELEADFPGISERARPVHIWPVKMSAVVNLHLLRIDGPLPGRAHDYRPTDLELAYEAASRGDFEEFTQRWERHRKRGGREAPEGLRYEAIALVATRGPGNAIGRLERALAMDPTSADVLHALAAFEEARGNWKQASEYRLKALRLQPQNEELNRALHHALSMAKEQESAGVTKTPGR